MQSNLRQHITSMVNDIIPLGGPSRQRTDDKGRAHPVSQCSSQEIHKKNTHTLKPLNPLSRHTPSQKSSVVERGNRAAVTFTSGSTKGFSGSQQSLYNCYVPIQKVQLNNHHHLNNNGSYQSAVKKDAPLQRQGSYDKQKEFALALCKQLNENLKVERPVLQKGNTLHKMLSVQPPLSSSSISESNKQSAPPNSQRRQSLDRRVIQQSQQSVEKMDKPIDLDDISSSPSQDDVHVQAATPGGRSLSLKRRRESSAERHGESKNLCQKESGFTPSSNSGSSSQISSSPKFIKCAFLKTSNAAVLTLSEKCSPALNNSPGDRIMASNHVAKQLFPEPRTDNHGLQTATLSTVVHETDHQKELMQRSTENKCPLGYSVTDGQCHSPSSTLIPKQEERCSPVSSGTSFSPDHKDRFKTISPLQQPEATLPSSQHSTGSHVAKTLTKGKKDEDEKEDLVWKDPLDLEFEEDVGLEICALSLSSSHSSEEDRLLSLQEILQHSARVPATPDKAAFSEPSTPGIKVSAEDLKKKATSYKNTLDQMLKEKEQNLKSKELEMQLLQTCKEDLLKLEEEDENTEEGLSHEQKEFLQRFSVTSCVIRDIHPGEEVFTLTNSGRLFNQQSLDLRKMGVTPNNRAQQTLLQAHSEQLLLLLSAGLFRRAYSSSPCQPQVTRWLFQMMSVHPNPIVSAQILQTLMHIALSAAQQIVEKSNKKYEVWVPSIQDVALVFLNMGVPFVSLFPLEDLQPPFNEGDLLESMEIQPDGPKSEKGGGTFPEHNFENIIKYLALCTALCPRVYGDEELLLMLTVVLRVSLETRLQLLPTGDLSCLLQHLLNNMTNWEMQLARVCQAITNLSEDHHNLRRLVQLLPHSGRGKQLRRHVSVSIISKLLNHRCTYTPSCTEFQLSDLRCYLPRMRPSLLLKGLIAAKTTEPQETDDCSTNPDQQAYYLCYSLLALTNEASNFEFLPSKQRNELLLLSAELEKHIKCDIRESEKMLYRSKVKDFVARIYTKWQVLLQRSRPQEGKLYDYWKPLPEDETPKNKTIELTEQEDTEESLSEESDMDQSDEKECTEEEDEVPMESEEKLEDSAEKIQEETEELHMVSCKIKDKQTLINLNDKDTDEAKDDTATNHKHKQNQLLGESSEGSVENEEDKNPIYLMRSSSLSLSTDPSEEEELLKDDGSLNRNGELSDGENDEPEKLELLGEHADVLEKTYNLLFDE
ncbi:SMC5-SMC6 complex localization factor protein 2 isoform X2 [Silurus meridionalis]|uniref:SMC5-SMC6 complex localization factor protein 2 isoform X2 n=1 Tax=Silurus meridionalis TaxID=175797 RepID=UPI001EEB48A0|nr:SMC5-SMC6 complex localization factor protein 2 isoform X2 [Silurus meridionalis]